MPKTGRKTSPPKKVNKGGRPKKKITRKTETIRLLPEEKEAFRRAADAVGMPMMSWLRSVGRKASGLDP